MKPVIKITLTDDNGIKFFGEGPCRLLQGVEKTGSLRSAAMEMEMAYSKANKILRQAENALGFPLTTRSTGGKDGGGSILTPEGKWLLQQYEAYRDACVQAGQELYRQYFPKIGCVIMASGLGKRFGGNKLMADFQGKPLLQQKACFPTGWWSPGMKRLPSFAGNSRWMWFCTTCPTGTIRYVWAWKRWGIWMPACFCPEISLCCAGKRWRC